MVSKLLYRVKSAEKPKKSKNRKENIDKSLNGGMYFDTTTTADLGQPLLLPEESCLAEDETAAFDLHCPREGFHLFGWGDVNFYSIKAKIYLTTYRVLSPCSLR